jgi:hypothetical protein
MRVKWYNLSALLLCLAVIGVGLVLPAKGAMIEQTLAQLTAKATDIISGEIIAKESQWNQDSTFIFTTVSIQVNELLKGSLAVPSTVEVLVPGGEVGDVGLGVEHAAQFEVGEEVIVFLSLLEGNYYGVTAWEQGKYTVENGQVVEKRMSVSSFKEEIRKALK